MSHVANIFEFGKPHRLHGHSASGASLPNARETARLIPGSQRVPGSGQRKPPQSILADGEWGATESRLRHHLHETFAQLVPAFLSSFAPAMLSTALADLSVICLVFWAASALSGGGLGPASLVLYAALFFLFAIQEGAYNDKQKSAHQEYSIFVRSVTWTTLLAGLALSWSPHRLVLLPLLLWSDVNICGLMAWRKMWQGVRGKASEKSRNVLIVGNARGGQVVADAFTRQHGRQECNVEFLSDQHFREGHGPAMLQRIARQRCIDEVIVATQDSAAAEVIVREAQSSRLDVSLAPDLFGAKTLRMAHLDGMPLMKIHEHRVPEWGLACKRLADVLLASALLVALLPVLLLVGVAIEFDSKGPVLYRAPRVGRKGQRFLCYKFRTMITSADAIKAKLRARNEREGAFFKISNDPRITRVGRFLRRYSLDELPQLWNVLLGDMSLVGPRPHPPDDVDRYRIEDLRRLDFIPGITGLWQVTARQDPSFQRCVAQDVHYIENWHLLLDMRILWKTIAAVLQGSGA